MGGLLVNVEERPMTGREVTGVPVREGERIAATKGEAGERYPGEAEQQASRSPPCRCSSARPTPARAPSAPRRGSGSWNYWTPGALSGSRTASVPAGCRAASPPSA